jgi:hypothetical protein
VIEGVNPQKVFNYLLQATETELNMGIMKRVLEFIKQTDIELTLYTYDSFLFSYPSDMDASQAKKLKEIDRNGRISYKSKLGFGLLKTLIFIVRTYFYLINEVKRNTIRRYV